MNEFIQTLQAEFERHANPEIAAQQKAYMRNQFEFYGIKAPVRKEILKPFLKKEYLPLKADLEVLVKTLFEKPQREFHHAAQELTEKYQKQFELEDIALLEYMVTHNSWWDTVDFIAVKPMGAYFKNYPEQRYPKVEEWLASNNMWLQRSAILFQLKYKEDMDTELLTHVIQPLLGSKEFFINKAIGWILRQYSRTNPDWVMDFVSKTNLAPLSKREALRLIKD